MFGGFTEVSCLNDDLVVDDDEYDCILDSLIEQREYCNAAFVGLGKISRVWSEDEDISRSIERKLDALHEAGFETFLQIDSPNNGHFWDLDSGTKNEIMQEMKDSDWIDKIDYFNIIDELYLHEYTYSELEDIIDKTAEEFPDKKLMVNFAATVTLPEHKIPDEKLDIVSLDWYPFYAGFDTCTNENKWKRKVNDLLTKLDAKTDKPLRYTAQGVTVINEAEPTDRCALSADNVRWSFEVADELGFYALNFWFAIGSKDEGDNIFVGYTEPENEEAFEEIKRIGKIIVKNG
jgi:hypothetical protein